MGIAAFKNRVTSAEELAEVIGSPSELVIKKQLSELDGHMSRFIAESPFVLIGTVGRDGSCDVSPRGDAPGSLAAVRDARTLLIPERRGNRRADSLRNIIETGRAALLFLIPGVGETLRVNGRACVIRDEEVLAPLAVEGKTPLVGVVIEVDECFFQCAKALIRSKLWEPSATGRKSSVPTLAEILVDQTRIEGQTVGSLSEAIETSYKNHLY
ncbi:MSMEG_1061 family FMN-dependent PPOX-type flavoprotein [Tautonia rosea]|uniref:MSMEG_1061 family FMN-dependent PPOX-type flavoprotein n=1 Tax=Tautonia rosea TaxID=2728037 RepID=UPI0014737E3D|nr:MSMEG_1061 family FMN-dependent PPOX-type flavoprotein [Tautonia rosea]